MLPGKKYTPDEILRLAAEAQVAGGVAVCRWSGSRVGGCEPDLGALPIRDADHGHAAADLDRDPAADGQRSDRGPAAIDQRSDPEPVAARSGSSPTSTSTPRQRARGAIMEDVVQQHAHGHQGRRSRGVASSRSASPTRARTRPPRTRSPSGWRPSTSRRTRGTRTRWRRARMPSSSTELETAKGKLLEAEKRLEMYKKQYAGQLPSQAESNQQAIQSAQLQLQAVSRDDQPGARAASAGAAAARRRPDPAGSRRDSESTTGAGSRTAGP